MNHKLLIAALALLLIFQTGISEVIAQRHVDRMLTYNPLEIPIPDELEEQNFVWIPSFGGWGTFGKYTVIQDTDHEWHHQLGVVLELFRSSNRNSLAVTTQAEFIYDPHNNINFNPRAIFWEEGLIFTRGFENFAWQTGYYHRCKHDIDNLGIGVERTTINGSFANRLLFHEQALLGGRFWFSPGIDIYTITYDRREVYDRFRDRLSVIENNSPDWYKMLASARVNFLWVLPISGQFNYYVSGYGNATAFSEDSQFFNRLRSYDYTVVNGGMYTGIEIRGGARFRMGLKAEYLSDTGVPLVPRNSLLMSVAVQALPLSAAR